MGHAHTALFMCLRLLMTFAVVLCKHLLTFSTYKRILCYLGAESVLLVEHLDDADSVLLIMIMLDPHVGRPRGVASVLCI